MDNHYRNIGKIVSIFGLKGEMIVQHHLGNKISPAKIRVIFLEQKKEELLPFFISSARKKNEDELLVKLEGVEDKEAAAKYLRREVWLRADELNVHTRKDNPIGWVGYHVFDAGKDLGPVLEVIEQPHQVLCRLEIQSREVLIPVNEETLDKMDHAGKRVLLNLPDGLLAVYLG
ncbi:MAG: 16S rRNA processing protein RimM [Bacteroidota bacterium]|nr:16S rRNA processing protein RimM [Bacteroidota bacterium]MDP4211290.1 16S rRNA processing protein RimM [Bacteroidota bacterium]MDP4250021.1 16S rRNA processing protein RimM [Bacteroidota bacterium]